jgi:NAD+ synthetase
MVQREIINDISPDFRRENQTQQQYLEEKSGSITDFVARYIGRSGAKGIVLGVSGGIDSFLVGALCAEACRKTGSALRLVILPKGKQPDIADACDSVRRIAEIYPAAEHDTVSIDGAYEGAVKELSGKLGFERDVYTLGNLQPRIRMMYQYALAKGMLVAGTDHATEAVTGFYTKYGDGGTDINPIQELVKDDIYDMAAMYGAPVALMEKKPAAGLGISADDESELGISYKDLCAYLKGGMVAMGAGKDRGGLLPSAHKRAMPASLKDEYCARAPYTILAVDFVYSFMEGGLACGKRMEALGNSIKYIKPPSGGLRALRTRLPPQKPLFVQRERRYMARPCYKRHKGIEFPDAALYRDNKKPATPAEGLHCVPKGHAPEQEQYSAYRGQQHFRRLKHQLPKSGGDGHSYRILCAADGEIADRGGPRCARANGLPGLCERPGARKGVGADGAYRGEDKIVKGA